VGSESLSPISPNFKIYILANQSFEEAQKGQKTLQLQVFKTEEAIRNCQLKDYCRTRVKYNLVTLKLTIIFQLAGFSGFPPYAKVKFSNFSNQNSDMHTLIKLTI